MRIIGQHGSIDVLYDNVILTQDDNLILCRFATCELPQFIIASYETAEQALLEFRRLHKTYELMSTAVFQFKSAEEVTQK